MNRRNLLQAIGLAPVVNLIPTPHVSEADIFVERMRMSVDVSGQIYAGLVYPNKFTVYAADILDGSLPFKPNQTQVSH